MKLMTFNYDYEVKIGLVTDKGIVDITKRMDISSLKQLIEYDKYSEILKYINEKPDYQLNEIEFLPVIPDPTHIFCIGTNYADHLQEAIDAGLPRSKTDHPPLFLRFADTLVGHNQPLLKSPQVNQLDYECELAVIIGKPGKIYS